MANRSFLISSIWVFDLIITLPRPSVYAFLAPPKPKIKPPVGKSGAGTCCVSASEVKSGSSISAKVALIISPKL